MATARDWIERLELTPHPEGGFYRETYRTRRGIALPGHFGGPRAYSTAIYYLLEAPDFSSLHRLASDETWFFHAGAPLTVIAITPSGDRHDITLGPDFERGERFQATIGAGVWFGARHHGASPAAYSLVSCAVSPGFAFEDFELARRADLARTFPQHARIIEEMTRT